MTVIGTCSICGGCVTEGISDRLVPPVPTCQTCGAVKKSAYGPVVPMQPKPVKPPTSGPAMIPGIADDYWTRHVKYPRLGDLICEEPRAIGIGTKLGSTQAKMGGGGVELFPFEKLPSLESIVDALNASYGPKRPPTDKYPFHGDLI